MNLLDATAACVRPSGWCVHDGATFQEVDCDGDGVKDLTCRDKEGSRGTRLSSQGCTDDWPSASPSKCPAAFQTGEQPICYFPTMASINMQVSKSCMPASYSKTIMQ